LILKVGQPVGLAQQNLVAAPHVDHATGLISLEELRGALFQLGRNGAVGSVQAQRLH